MARSIHDTWGVMARAMHSDWADPAVRDGIVAEMRRNGRRQRHIRQSERRLRLRRAIPPQPVHPDNLPIFIDDVAPHIFHPVTEEDVRAVLGRLPPGSIDGLRAVRMCVDWEEEPSEGCVRDPFTGRLRREVIPGVFRTSVLGDYSRLTATIRLFAYACEPARLGPLALYFKVRTLQTLLHEAAHHFDLTFRTGRSRWDVGDKHKREYWAEKSELEQSARTILPYVRERYPVECENLTEWIREHGGVALPVPTFLLEGRAEVFDLPEEIMDSLPTRPDAARPFIDLMRSVLGGRDRTATRVDFARDLHENGVNDPAREVLRGVLVSCPDNAEALAVSACICQCDGEDFETGESLCLRAVAADPGCMEAWRILLRNYWMQSKYEAVALTCERALSRLPAGDDDGLYFFNALVESHLLLSCWADAGTAIARMRVWGPEDARLMADVYAVVAHCWREQWEEALRLASSLLSGEMPGRWRPWLSAAVFESAHRLGRSPDADAFGNDGLAALKSNKFTMSWAERIARL